MSNLNLMTKGKRLRRKKKLYIQQFVVINKFSSVAKKPNKNKYASNDKYLKEQT